MRRHLTLAAALLLCLTAGSAPQQDSGMLLLVRHAEQQADGTNDPALAVEGIARARVLASTVRQAGIAAIYTTQLTRTGQTAHIVSEELGVPVIVEPITSPDVKAHAEALLARIQREHPGQTVLVVGHSNTIPVIAAVAAGSPVRPIDDREYDAMIVVGPGPHPGVLRLHY